MRPAAILSVVVALVLVGAGLVMAVWGAVRPDGRQAGDADPAAVARGTALPEIPPLADGLDLAVWAERSAPATGVPARALEAYGPRNGPSVPRRRTAACRGRRWPAWAGSSRTTGGWGGRTSTPTEWPGRRSSAWRSTARRAWPRSPTPTPAAWTATSSYDRAVGPMQFLPATWARYGADGDGDGVRNADDLDDAAAAAARYLCANGRDTADGDGWWDGVLAYNRSIDYARRVWTAADRYATALA